MSNSNWMPTERVARIIDDADSVERIEFYLNSATSNRGMPEINCRLLSLRGMSREQRENLVNHLNEAIKPILRIYSDGMLSQAANQLRRFL